MKTDIIYSKNQLFVNFEGSFDWDQCSQLKKKIDCITQEYGISEVIFNLKYIELNDEMYHSLKRNFKNITMRR